ncbi:MAG: 50S ribosomal protein L16 [Candidatus Altiarchaeales archaeon]|nr:50S ribosomal protein L16 [Candidatus Altiarchaeales archaeon]
MASLRPAKAYRWDSPAFTRVSKNPSDSYISGIPANKINRFDMGNAKGEFTHQASVVMDEQIQVRHNALEAARITTQYTLEKDLGVTNYYFKIRTYPHHVMRENVQASGAGADRVSEGMRRAFGKPVGRAARLNKRQPIFTVFFNPTEARIRLVKKALNKACKKLPGATKIVVSEKKK